MSVIESGVIHHAGFVVRDVHETAEKLTAAGIGPWAVWTIEPGTTTVRGEAVPFTFRVAFAAAGDASFELLAPVDGHSVYVDHLEAHGEGFHHTCLAYPTREALHAAKAELEGQGRAVVQSADLGELGEFCYFEFPELGSFVELLYLTELPPPETTVG